MKEKLIISTLMFLAGKVVYATSLLVPTQYATIQSAIVAAVPGDTVLVAANGTYFENLDFLGKDLVVRTPDTVADRFTTIIDGGSSGSVVKFINLETNNAKLEGFTIRNGTGTVRDWSYYLQLTPLVGGGIICDSPRAFGTPGIITGSSPTLSYLVIENNSAEFGGGISAWLGSYPVIENTIVRNNTCTNMGGGISIFECFNTVTNPPIVLTNVEVTHNTGGFLGGCGIVANYSSNVTLINCTVSDNGGSVLNGEALFVANGGNFEIQNSVIWTATNNLLYNQGGLLINSNISNSIVSNTNGPINLGANVLLVSPAFVNSTTGNFHITSVSPCINAGTLTNAPTKDLDGNIRTGNPDIGAYEFVDPNYLSDDLLTLENAQAYFENNTLAINSIPARAYVFVFDVTGKLCYIVNADHKECLKINMPQLNIGIYTVKIVSGKNTIAKKAVKI